jgi:hypothetical protein
MNMLRNITLRIGNKRVDFVGDFGGFARSPEKQVNRLHPYDGYRISTGYRGHSSPSSSFSLFNRLLLHPVLLLFLLSFFNPVFSFLRRIPHQKSSSIFFDDNNKGAENQIIIIKHSTNIRELSSLSMGTNRGDSDRGTNATWHRGTNTSCFLHSGWTKMNSKIRGLRISGFLKP